MQDPAVPAAAVAGGVRLFFQQDYLFIRETLFELFGERHADNPGSDYKVISLFSLHKNP